MKKLFFVVSVILCFIVAGCSNSNGNTNANNLNSPATNNSSGEVGDGVQEASTRTIETALGAVEIPADPQRIIVLSGSYAGHALFLNAPVVAVDSFTYANPRFAEYLDGVEQVSADNLEQIIELDPDLIITDDYATNIDQLNEIAPTVALTYASQTYLSRVVEVGKIVNKQAEAEAWVTDFEARAIQAGNDIRSKLGDDVTVTVIESWEKDLFLFGDNYARGTEILYDAMKLNKTEAVEALVGETGYSALSPETLPKYAGDFIIFSKSNAADNTFLDTETYKNIPAVKNNKVMTADASEFYFNDPITLEYQLQFLIDGFLGQ